MSIRLRNCTRKCTVRTGRVELQSDEQEETPAENVRGKGEWVFAYKIGSG